MGRSSREGTDGQRPGWGVADEEVSGIIPSAGPAGEVSGVNPPSARDSVPCHYVRCEEKWGILPGTRGLALAGGAWAFLTRGRVDGVGLIAEPR